MKSEEQELNAVVAVIRENKALFALCGVGLTIAGVVAVFFPFFSTLTINYMVGVVLFAGGVMTLLGSFTVRGTGPFFGFFLAGTVEIGAGLFLINNPEIGTVLVTFSAGFVFLVSGAHQISMAMALKKHPLSFWLWPPGAINIALGLVIISGFLEGRPILLGVAIGINFIATGGAMIAIANMIKIEDEI